MTPIIVAVPDNARVVRGGLQNPEDLKRSANNAYQVTGTYGLSVWAGEGMTVKELVTIGGVRNGSVAIGWADAFKWNGFEIGFTGRKYHATVYLGESIADETIWERFRNSFEEIVENPFLVD